MNPAAQKILTSLVDKNFHWKLMLFEQWDSIIGSMKNKVRIEKISHDALLLGVCHPTWAQELLFLTPMLKQKINTALKEERIKTIHFKIVPFTTKQSPAAQIIEEQTQATIQEHCFTFMEQACVQNVASDELRDVLTRFYLRCQKRNPDKPRSTNENQISYS